MKQLNGDVLYQLKNNKLRYTTMTLYSEKLPRNISSGMTEFYTWRFVLFFTELFLLPHSYLSLEAET
jgi:hypothetical protein